jgi:MarR family transcriptional regulator, organic hydroperoxide resistance regulator
VAARNEGDKAPRLDELGEVLQFMRELWAVVHALQSASKRMEQHLGVTGPQRLALRVVGLFPGISAGDLARLLHVHPSTLTGVLHRLGEAGLLARETPKGDRRRAVLRLTRAGARVNARRRGTVEAAISATLGTLSARERATTRRALSSLAEAMGKP